MGPGWWDLLLNDDNRRRSIAANKYLRVILLVVLVVAVSIALPAHTLVRVFEFVLEHENLGVLILLAVYALLGATFVPSEPLTLLLAAYYGPLPAAMIATVGNTLAGMLEFYIGGSIGNLADFEARKARLPFHLGKLPMRSPLFLFLGRMLPGFGPKFVSLACGVYRVPMRTYLWVVFVSNLLGAILVAWAGYGLAKLF
jgi:uncharacterized membrane protein YdjX (TVP38/TMEM64 family)